MSMKAEKFDLASPVFKRDPSATLAHLRADGPLVRVRLPFFGAGPMAM